MQSSSQPPARPADDQQGYPPADPIPLTLINAVRLVALGFLLATVVWGLLYLMLRQPEPAPIVLHPPPTPAPTSTPLPTATPSPLTVFVSGGVTHPGVYSMAWDARVADALSAAGGLQAGVDGALINQAERLFDGAQVHVPLNADGVAAEATGSGPPPGLSGTLASPVQANGAANGAAGGPSSGLVNLNTASTERLMSLPGIGPSKAAAIIANRPYESVDDLDRVPGFGTKTIDQLRELVTTG